MNTKVINKAHIGLSPDAREQIGHLLNTLLADEVLLYIKTKNFHWNVTGMNFQQLHEFFDAEAALLLPVIDDIAERARALDIASVGTLAEYTELSRLGENPDKALPETSMLADLLHDHETIIRSLRTDLETCSKLGDEGTTDFFTGLMQQHEKSAWMIRSFIS